MSLLYGELNKELKLLGSVYASLVNIIALDIIITEDLVFFQGGGGGGVSPRFFVKLDFEIAVDQQTRALDRNFKGFPDSGCPSVPADSHAHIWSIYGPILLNHLNMLKTMLGVLYL